MATRPRRAQRTPLARRVTRLVAPTVAAGVLVTGAAAGGWSSVGSVEAAPASAPLSSYAAPSASSSLARAADELRSVRVARGDRSELRPALTMAEEKRAIRAAAAAQEAADAAEAEVKVAEKKAAKKKAAKKKAAEKKAAKKKAAEKKAARLDLTVVGSRYTTAALKLRKDPAKDADFVAVIGAAKKVKITDTRRKGYRLVVVNGKGRWVTADYLSKKKPSASKGASAGVSGASCSKSSGIESGLVSNGRKVYRAICAAFPQVSSFGGRRGGGGFHGSGRAVDAMIADSGAGWRLATWVRAHARELGVSEVIYAQKIWTVQRSGEGWRGMSDRGSATANHYDHVHVSVY